VRARTSDGTIRLQVGEDSVMSGDWDLQTGDGSVVLTLPAEFNGVLDAGTRDGAVRANYKALRDAERAGEDRDERRRTLQATLGTGGRTLRIRTGDGSIRIE
jgi:Putative adhesin